MARREQRLQQDGCRPQEVGAVRRVGQPAMYRTSHFQASICGNAPTTMPATSAAAPGPRAWADPGAPRAAAGRPRGVRRTARSAAMHMARPRASRAGRIRPASGGRGRGPRADHRRRRARGHRVRHGRLVDHVPVQEGGQPDQGRRGQGHPGTEVPAQHRVHEQHRQQSVDERAERDRVDVDRPVTREVGGSARRGPRARQELAGHEERSPAEAGPDGEDGPAQPGDGGHAQVLALEPAVVRVFVGEVEIAVFTSERTYTYTCPVAVGARRQVIWRARASQEDNATSPATRRSRGASTRSAPRARASSARRSTQPPGPTRAGKARPTRSVTR